MTAVPPLSRPDSSRASSGLTRSPRSDNLSTLAAESLTHHFAAQVLSGHKFEHLISTLKDELALCSYAELLLSKASLKEVISRPELQPIQEVIQARDKIHIAETLILPLFREKPAFAYGLIESEILLTFQWFTDFQSIVLAALNIYKSKDTPSSLKEKFLLTLLKMAVHIKYTGNFADEIKPLTNACLDCKEINLTTYTETFLDALKLIPMDVFFSLVMYSTVSNVGSFELSLLDRMGFKSYENRTTHRQETKPIMKWEKILSHVAAKKKISDYAALLARDLRKECILHLKQISFRDLHHHQTHFRLTDYSNQLSRFVAENILNELTLKRRLHLTEFWLEVADELEKLHDYHSAFSIMSGLTRIEVDRLKSIWGALSEKHKILNSSLRELCSLEHNYSHLKKRFEELEKKGVAYIPFMAILLKDLTLIDQGNPDFIEGKINSLKRDLLWKQLFQFKMVQKKVSDNKPFETDFCFTLNAKKRTGSDLLLNKSYEIQPPAIPTA